MLCRDAEGLYTAVCWMIDTHHAVFFLHKKVSNRVSISRGVCARIPACVDPPLYVDSGDGSSIPYPYPPAFFSSILGETARVFVSMARRSLRMCRCKGLCSNRGRRPCPCKCAAAFLVLFVASLKAASCFPGFP